MCIKLRVEETMVNPYAFMLPKWVVQRITCTEEEKEAFWEHMDQELSATQEGERISVGGYVNGHIGRSREGIERMGYESQKR